MTPEQWFQRLTEWGREQRPRIHLHARPLAAWHGADGEAYADQNGNGQVDVWLAMTDARLPVIAAHEVGHVQRELAGLMAKSYLEARVTIREKSPEQILASVRLATRELMLDEEALAWAGGRVVLVGMGFDDWALFEHEQARSLEVYGVILSLKAAA